MNTDDDDPMEPIPKAAFEQFVRGSANAKISTARAEWCRFAAAALEGSATRLHDIAPGNSPHHENYLRAIVTNAERIADWMQAAANRKFSPHPKGEEYVHLPAAWRGIPLRAVDGDRCPVSEPEPPPGPCPPRPYPERT